jgi:hypothetical protein
VDDRLDVLGADLGGEVEDPGAFAVKPADLDDLPLDRLGVDRPK